jgi:hypothetical protein
MCLWITLRADEIVVVTRGVLLVGLVGALSSSFEVGGPRFS